MKRFEVTLIFGAHRWSEVFVDNDPWFAVGKAMALYSGGDGFRANGVGAKRLLTAIIVKPVNANRKGKRGKHNRTLKFTTDPPMFP